MSGPMLAVGALVVLCCSSSSAVFMMGGDDDSTSGPSSPGPSRIGPVGPVGPVAPPPPGKVKGWSRTTTGIKNVDNVPTPEGCIAKAKEVGSPYWIHRNSTHPTKPNSCDIKAWTDVYAGDESDTVHTSGCTYGGNPQTGCTPWPAVQGYPATGVVNVTPNAEFQTLNPNECVTKAKEISALGWGYRTANHPSAPNTCFFYSNFSAGFNGNPQDPAHIFGCTNGKSLSNKCT